MATANLSPTSPASHASHATIMSQPPIDNGTTLIARAEALNAFMKMQPAADQARQTAASPTMTNASPPHPASHAQMAHTPSHLTDSSSSGCFCFGSSSKRASPPTSAPPARRREYYPDNLSVQPKPHPWDDPMEWLIVASVDFLERTYLHERNLFAVSAVDDLVRAMTVPLRSPLPPSTDPHVAAGVIKAKIRHADQPLVDKSCLRDYIDAHANQPQPQDSQDAQPPPAQHPTPPASYKDSVLAKTIESMEALHGARRAYVLARFMRLLGRVSANVEDSKMNAHCLAKCVAPSMLHWDPNSGFALLMLGKITAYVMTMIEDARVFDENLCAKIEDLNRRGGW